jgi:hypothetical protein
MNRWPATLKHDGAGGHRRLDTIEKKDGRKWTQAERK